MRLSVTGAAIGAATLVVPALVATGPATPVEAAPAHDQSCRGMNKLIKQSPRETTTLPGGATMRVWDNKKKVTKKEIRRIKRTTKKKAVERRKIKRLRTKAKKHLRIVAVTVPKQSALKGRLVVNGPITAVRKTGVHARKAPDATFVTNGSVFKLGGGGAPRGPQVVDGEIVKARRSYEGAIATLSSGTTEFVRLALRGHVYVNGVKYQVEAVNDERVTSDRVTVFTRHWGDAPRPKGTTELVVDEASGFVVGVRSGTIRASEPPRGTFVLAATGALGDELSLVPVGAPVERAYYALWKTGGQQPVVGEDGRPVDPIWSAVGHSARLLANGQIKPDQCTPRNELRRPRTVYGKLPDGDLIVMTVNGRYGKGASKVGGASMHQALSYIKHLGATEAVILDGGGSTTLLVRRTPGERLVRFDRGVGVGKQRKVGNAFGFGTLAPSLG